MQPYSWAAQTPVSNFEVTLSVCWSVSVSGTLVGSVGYLSLLILLGAASGYRYTQADLGLLKKALIWSSRLTALIVILTGAHLESRLTLDGILTEDPNYLCAYYLFGIVNVVELILSSPRYTQKFGALLEAGIYLALGVASGSRGGLLAIAGTVFVTVIGCLLRNKISFKSLFLPVLLMGAVTVLVIFLPYLVPQNVLERFYIQEIIDSQGTGRYRLWQEYLNIFKTSTFWRQLMGYGASGLAVLAEQRHLTTFHVAHNIFIEHLIGLGFIGLVLYLTMLWQFIKAAFKQQLFSTAVLWGIIVLMLSTSFGGKPYWNILIYIICCTGSLNSRTQ